MVVQTGLDFYIEIKVWVSLAHIIKSCSILVTTLFFKLVCLLYYVAVISWVKQDGLKDSVIIEEVCLSTASPWKPALWESTWCDWMWHVGLIFGWLFSSALVLSCLHLCTSLCVANMNWIDDFLFYVLGQDWQTPKYSWLETILQL